MKKRRKLLWRLFPSYLALIVVSLAVSALYASAALTRYSQERTRQTLEEQARLVEVLVEGKWSPDRTSELNTLVKQIASRMSSRVTLMAPSGDVLAGSIEDAIQTENLAVRPEMRDALAGKIGYATRFSFALNAMMTFVAIPVEKDGHVIGIVRTSRPAEGLAQAVKPFHRELIVAGLVIVLLPLALSLYVSYRIHAPLRQLKEAMARFASGDLEYRLDVPNSQEFGALSEATNEMAAQLHARIFMLTEQHSELEAVLSGMVEAVLVIDTNERMTRVNRAAERLFQIDQTRVRNRSVQETIRHSDLHRFVRRTLELEEPVEGELTIVGTPDQYLQAHGAKLRDGHGQCMGLVVVLNDVSRLKTLEDIRRDFVANVSHELKTPITSIKGFLETLKEGAIRNPEHAERFLHIVIKHTDRLSAIIEDLLSLSRIERDAEKGEMALEEKPLRPVFEAVVKACGKTAELKDITLELEVSDELLARINPRLLEQALVNLVDNAIKYSEPGHAVKISGQTGRGEVVIKVQDTGCGIPREHLQRIFERFYRVDKARSRKVGGTGLGLAIVKHIVHAHDGAVSVESSPGRGSSFSIHLPSV